MQEISYEEFKNQLRNLVNKNSYHYWRNSFTTEPNVKSLALLMITDFKDGQKTTAAALQVLEQPGSLKFIIFTQESKREYIIPFYDLQLAYKEFTRITS